MSLIFKTFETGIRISNGDTAVNRETIAASKVGQIYWNTDFDSEFKCKICGQAFKRNNAKKVHMKMHFPLNAPVYL